MFTSALTDYFYLGWYTRRETVVAASTEIGAIAAVSR